MSPEFRVYIPEPRVTAFKKALSDIPGARIFDSTPESYAEQLAAYLEEYKQRVVSLREPKAPHVETRILNGYRRLIEDIGHDIPESLIQQRIPQIRGPIGDIFLECTRKEPKTVFRGSIAHTRWGYDILRPNEVHVLIERYGLADGERKTYNEIGKSLNRHGGRAHEIATKALRKLRSPNHYKQIKNVFSENTPEEK